MSRLKNSPLLSVAFVLLTLSAGLARAQEVGPLGATTDEMLLGNGAETDSALFSGGAVPDGQRQVADAQNSHRGLFFAEVKNVRVVRALADDTQGLKHQKWVVALDNGNELTAIYNTDICDRVQFNVGDRMTIGGQYIWEKGGGLIHWLHSDPRHKRPDGYVEVNGRRFGAITHPDR